MKLRTPKRKVQDIYIDKAMNFFFMIRYRKIPEIESNAWLTHSPIS